jgi:N-methylhydantoinase B
MAVELEQIVARAEQPPFRAARRSSSSLEAVEAAVELHLSEHRLDCRLVFSVERLGFLYRAGERNEDLYRTMLANTRLPDAFDGDLHAQIAACNVACQALGRTLRRYGYETVMAATDLLFDHSELAMGQVLGDIPDGVYCVSAAADNDGISEDSIPYDITVKVAGDEIVVDLSEAAPQTAGPVNAPLATTVSCVRCAILAVAGIADGANEGYFRPIEIRTREGTIFHARLPAPMFMYAWPLITAIDHIMRALAPTIPERIPAQTGCDVGAMLAWGFRDDGSYWADGCNHPGGHGAAYAHGDGGAPLMRVGIEVASAALLA